MSADSRTALRSAGAAVLLSVSLSRTLAARAQSAEPGGVRLVAFHPEQRTLRPGEAAVSELVFRNAGFEPRTLWIGYSVADPDGRWFDIAPDRVVLDAGATAARIKSWSVPVSPRPESGKYRVIMAVWTAPPGSDGARRLFTADRRDAFRVQAEDAALIDDPEAVWRATQHPLGRGRMRPEQVRVNGAGFKLWLAARSCDGAELRTIRRYPYGEYSARFRTPDAPGSLSALFLYAGVSGGNDEIDIEIYNDASRLATITSWLDGVKRRKRDVRLPFDPSAGYHDYAIRWSAKELIVTADGVQLARWTGGYARSPMHVLASVWFPAWLKCEPLTADGELSIERILLAPGDSAPKH